MFSFVNISQFVVQRMYMHGNGFFWSTSGVIVPVNKLHFILELILVGEVQREILKFTEIKLSAQQG